MELINGWIEYIIIAKRTETITINVFPTKIIDMNKGRSRRKTVDNNLILSNLSPRYPDRICPKKPVNIIADTIELAFEPNSKLNTEGINVLNTVNDNPTTNEIRKKIDKIEFCFLSLKSFGLIISIFSVFGINFIERGNKKAFKIEVKINAWCQLKYNKEKYDIRGPKETPIDPKTPWNAFAFAIFLSKVSEINVSETGWWILAKSPNRILLSENISTLFETLTKSAENKIPNWENTINFFGPYLLYKKDIGREPTPKQKLTIPNISPTSAAFREKKSIKLIYILGINIIMMWFDMWDKLKTNRMGLEGKLYFFSARRAALPDNPRK